LREKSREQRAESREQEKERRLSQEEFNCRGGEAWRKSFKMLAASYKGERINRIYNELHEQVPAYRRQAKGSQIRKPPVGGWEEVLTAEAERRRAFSFWYLIFFRKN
jgi:hypothetical protein